MKGRDFQRSVKARKFDRSAGDAPSLGKVARMPRREARKAKRRRRRVEGARQDRSASSRRTVVLVWSAVFSLVTLAVLGGIFGMWLKSKRDAPVAGVGEAAPNREKRVKSRFDSPPEAEALALVSRALAAGDEAAVAELFRTGGSPEAEVVEFLREWRSKEGGATRTEWLGSVDANGLLIDAVVVTTGSFPAEGNRLALLTPDDEGRWKVDYEAFARKVRPSWKEILDPAGSGGVARVMVAKDSYFNGPFRETDGWICFGMATPDEEVILYGYCRAGSAQETAMKRITGARSDERGGRRMVHRATLEIGRLEGGGVRQFEIRRVLAEDWVLGEKAFDGSGS